MPLTAINALNVLGHGEANGTYIEFVYMAPQVWLTFQLTPPADYWASLILYQWVDVVPNSFDGFVQHPQTLFHYFITTADVGMGGWEMGAISTNSQPGLVMYRNRDIVPQCALVHLEHIDFKTREIYDEAVKHIAGLSKYDTSGFRHKEVL